MFSSSVPPIVLAMTLLLLVLLPEIDRDRGGGAPGPSLSWLPVAGVVVAEEAAAAVRCDIISFTLLESMTRAAEIADARAEGIDTNDVAAPLPLLLLEEFEYVAPPPLEDV